MQIGQRIIAPNQPPYIIAEIGVNHDGSVDRASALVDAAHAAGADAVKLQFFEADRLLSKAARLAKYQQDGGAADPFEMLRALQLSVDDIDLVFKRARTVGMHCILSVFTVELVAVAEAIAPDAYKTASPDIINQPLIDAIAATGRPVILSTGAASQEDVECAASWVDGVEYAIMQCVSAYPVPDEHAAIGGRIALSRLNPRAIGYSDHTTSVDTGALAVASGACMLEKHLTHDRAASGPDHAASLDPAQFAEYVRLAHRAFAMLGAAAGKRVLPIEQDVRQISRQSLTTTADLPAGHVLCAADITVKRPGIGISPAQLKSIIGRRTAISISADEPITYEALEP